MSTRPTVTPSGVAYRGPHVALDLCTLDAGEIITVVAPPADETVVVLLAGAVTFDGTPASRPSTFTDRATAVYLPPAAEVEVRATAPTDLALGASTDGTLAAVVGAQPHVVRPDDVVVHSRGRPPWQREIHDIVDARVPAQRLLVGETFNAPGQWSSFPPHKHDGDDGEPALDEVYAFRFDRPEGFGFQGVYETAGPEHAHFLRDGSVVGFARGYHPVCAAPGYRLCYLWVLGGLPRRLAMHEDPAHRWLHDDG